MKPLIKTILILVAFSLVSCGGGDKKPETRSDKIKKQFSPWDGAHWKLGDVIEGAMNDPDSYEHDKTTYIDMGDHIVVTTIYRGRNAFGGMVRGSVSAKVSIDVQIIEIVE